MRKLVLLCVLPLIACAADIGAHGDFSLVTSGSPEEAAVLALVNDRAVTQVMFDDDVGLDRRAAAGIIDTRSGADGVDGNSDDVDFTTIDEVDRVRYVGNRALEALLDYAEANGYGGATPGTAPAYDREASILALVNDESTTFVVLDDQVGLDRRAAGNIIEERSGADGVLDTDDDVVFESLAALDAVSYVGERALDRLYAYAISHGFGQSAANIDVIFSPQPFASSHATRIVTLIDAATESLDIAMYSFSTESLYDALERAVTRGVDVRIVFETANSDRRKTGSSLDATRSARLENMGINVRYVNKVMHHKFVIIDGPRDDANRASTGLVASGSANWSNGGATRYDEDTLFVRGVPAITVAFQREFDLMWEHSRDFAYDTSLPYALSTHGLSSTPVDPDAQVYFTSDNFNVSGTTFRVTGRNTVSDALVNAIQNATTSIHVAAGHLRSRPVSEALIAHAAAHPEIDVRIYVDGQEWVSEWSHNQQLDDLDDCLVDAGTSAARRRRCMDRGFRFGYQMHEAGIDIRFKYYAYRWHYSYAKQMHHKFMIIDGDELWTGSYNLSDNAEHNTFENVVMLRGDRFTDLIADYEVHFEALWNTNRNDGTYDRILNDTRTRSVIPIVFSAVAMDWGQVDTLRREIRSNCPDVNTNSYRNNPERHTVCYRPTPPPGPCGGATCSDDEYCDYATDFACGGAGTCRPRVRACTRIYQPVCGCDGQTYSNLCVANNFGTDAQAMGRCEDL